MAETTSPATQRILKPLAGLLGGVAIALALHRLCGSGAPLWVLAKLLLALGLMVVLLRQKVVVGLTMFAGALFLGLAFGVPFIRLAHGFTFGVANPADAELHRLGITAFRIAVMVTLINFLGQALIDGGGVRKLVGSLERLLRDARLVLAAIPAFIGLLPMPGGAMLSAPMVGEMGDRLKLTPVQKTLCNLWFRHIWEWWWPLFPAVLIVLDRDYYGSMKNVILYMAPFTIVAVLLGWFFILRPIPRPHMPRGTASRRREVLTTLSVIWPAMVVVLAVFLIRLPKPFDDWVLPAALVVTNAVLVASLRMNRAQFAATVRKAVQWRMLLLVAGVYVLRGIFEMPGAPRKLAEALTAIHAPAMIVCFVVPFLLNLISGYNLAGISMAFPLLTYIFTAETGLAGMAVAYAGGFIGVLCSPVHLCLALTREYFHAEWGALYARLIPLLLGLVALAALIGWLG